MASLSWKMKSNRLITMKSTGKLNTLFSDSLNLLVLKNRRKNIGILKDTVVPGATSGPANVAFTLKKGQDSSASLNINNTKTNDLSKNHINADTTYIHLRFKMDKIYCLIDNIIEEKLNDDEDAKCYNSEKHLDLCQQLSREIKDRIKSLENKRYRVVCVVSIVEKRYQGVDYQMRFMVDTKMDNFICYRNERPTFFIVAMAFLVHKD